MKLSNRGVEASAEWLDDILNTQLPWWKEYLWYPIHRASWWAWDWLRYHTTHRFHKLDLRSAGDDYRYGYLDRDHAMLLACFKCLCEFVEVEMDIVNWEYKRDVEAEIQTLYLWWTKERLCADYEKDNEMLLRLIKIRGHLWT